MNDDKDPKSPATTSGAHDRMVSRWAMMEALLGGTETMRAAGEAFLPKHAQETDLDYEHRLEGAVLLNMVEQTLDTLAGKPFTEPLKPGKEVPATLVETIFPDVDLQGNNIDVFARQWFKEGMAKAFAHVLVDMPRVYGPGEGEPPRTLADDRREGLRPYWVLVRPENVLFARAVVQDGYEVLTHIRILEAYTEQEGFAEVEQQRIRVLEPGYVGIWKPKPKKRDTDKDEWELVDEWETGLGYIPFVTFYADREGFMEGKPPLQDLGWLNIAHWQSYAEQRHILSVARFPIMACSGGDDEGSVTILSPNRILYNPDAQGKFYYVEHSGAAIESGNKDLENLERQMSGYGAEFLKKKPGNQTATARALDSAEASSDLAAMTGVFEDALAQVLDITAEWLRLGVSGGRVGAVKEYEIVEESSGALEFVKYLREKNDISREAVIEWAKARGYLSEDFDAEADWEQLVGEIEARSGLLAESGLNLGPEEEEKKGGETEE